MGITTYRFNFIALTPDILAYSLRQHGEGAAVVYAFFVDILYCSNMLIRNR
jgi:hypothetical protein